MHSNLRENIMREHMRGLYVNYMRKSSEIRMSDENTIIIMAVYGDGRVFLFMRY